MQEEFEAFPVQVPPFKHTEFGHAFNWADRDWGDGVGIGIQWPIGPELIDFKNKKIIYNSYLFTIFLNYI